MEEHINALALICRICGQITPSAKNRSKLAKHKTELLAVYNLDVDEDQVDIHPSFLCNKCRLQVKRTHTSMQHGKPYGGYLPQIRKFQSHTSSCSVCRIHATHKSLLQPKFAAAGPSTPTTAAPPELQAGPSSSTSAPPELQAGPSSSTSAPPELQAGPSSSTSAPLPELQAGSSSMPPPQPSLSTATRAIFKETAPDPAPATQGKKRVWSVKASLKDVRRDYARKRTQEASTFISDFCSRQKENQLDLLYFLLTENLHGSGDSRYNEVLTSWKQETIHLSAEDCLAMRVTTKTSKAHYQAQYQRLKSKGVNILKPPHVLTELEKTFMPGSVRFRLQGGEDVIHHTPVKVGQAHVEFGELSFDPVNLNEDDFPGLETPFPNMKAMSWPYSHALAKTLEELDPEIAEGMSKVGLDPEGDHLVITTVKDGADGMGDVSIIKAARDRLLPDKAFRAAFAIIKCEVEKDGERVTVYEPDAPDSTFITRPLIEAIGDENNRSSAVVLLEGMEHDREVLRGRELSVNVDSVWRRHSLKFFNSMIDEKLDRADGGLQGSGSRYVCTLCHATKEMAKSELGSFCISRSYEETKATAQYLQVNPDNVSAAELSEVARGVKSYPVLRSDPKQKLLDATHADINLGNFFKKVIICEIARCQSWDITRDLKPMFDDAEKRFNDNLTATIGLVPKLMMPGNFARDLFNQTKVDNFLSLIPDKDRKQKLKEILNIFVFLRKVYRSTHPNPEDVCLYKDKAVKMGRLLLVNFTYVGWPNYLHKIIEHVQEIIQDPEGPGAVGTISGEGNEAANKLFRELRGHFSRKTDESQSLKDIIWYHWLYTSPKLRRISHVKTRKYQCSNCNELGHNARSCQR